MQLRGALISVSALLIAGTATVMLFGFPNHGPEAQDSELLSATKPDYSAQQWLKVKRSILMAEVVEDSYTVFIFHIAFLILVF